MALGERFDCSFKIRNPEVTAAIVEKNSSLRILQLCSSIENKINSL